VRDDVDLSWITEQLALGGRAAGLNAVRHGVHAIVDLRDEDCHDATALAARGVELLHLPTPDRCGVAAERLVEGVAFVRAHLGRGARVLVHCHHGIGRSATLALCVLVAEGMAPLAALELAKRRRACVSPSPEQFECWASWLRAHGHDAPRFEHFAAIAYRGPA
jgi:protein-tyrosine phosphatase